MAYTSKYKGKEIDDLLDIVAQGGGGEGGVKEDGYYPKMSVGMADELVGRGDVQDAYINFRPSGGVNKNIKDGAARIKAIKGNSVVWSNIASPLSDITQRPNWSLEYEGGILYGTVTTAAPSHSISVQISAHNTIPNHTYLVYVKTSNSEGVESLNMYFGGEYPAIAANGATIVTATSADKMYIYPFSSMGNSIGVGASFTIEELQIVDLTLMCSAGNEPKTIEEFNERKPMNIADEYAYEAGTLYSTKVDALKSVGDNAWDADEEIATVIGGINYHCTVDNLAADEVYFSTNKGTVHSEDNLMPYKENGIYTFPANGYVYILNLGTPKAVCVCIEHSYEKPIRPHLESTKDLSWIKDIEYESAPLFPNGMRSAGSAFDEIRFNPTKKKWEAVKRIGETKVGNLSWNYIGVAASYPYGFIYTTLPQKKYGANNILNERYSLSRGFNKNHSIFGNDSGNTIYIVDSDYTDATIFKNEMADAIIYYELAEPIVVELDYPTEETNMDYRVWDFGTEEAITSEPSAPFRAGIEYGFNATDDIRSLLERVAQLEARLTQLTNE